MSQWQSSDWESFRPIGRGIQPPTATGWIRVFDMSKHRRQSRNIGTGHGRGEVAVGAGGIWVVNTWSRTLSRLDPKTLALSATMKLGKVPAGVAIVDDRAWVVARNGWLWSVLSPDLITKGIARLGGHTRALAASDGKLWVLRDRGELIGIEPATGEVTSRSTVPGGARRLLGDDNAVWVISRRGRRLMRIDPRSGRVEARLRLPGRALALASDANTVWVGCRETDRRRNSLLSVDARTVSLQASRPLPGRPRALASGMNALWIACESLRRNGAIYRLGSDSNELETAVESTNWPVERLAVVGESLLALMTTVTTRNTDASGFLFDADGGRGGGSGGP